MELFNLKEKKWNPNPISKANLISLQLFWWVNGFMSIGSKKELEVSDLYDVLPEDKSENLGLILQREWDNQLTKCKQDSNKKNKRKPSLLTAYTRIVGFRYFLLCCLVFLEDCVFKIVQPLCLGQLMHYFRSNDDAISETHAYLYGTGITICSVLYTFIHSRNFFSCQLIGMQLRVAACSLIYRKSLLLSQKGLGETTVGQMVNLMSNDVNRFDLSPLFFPYLFIGPMQLLITTVILLYVIGPSCLFGLAVLIFLLPLQGWIGKVLSKLRLETAKRTDERIRIMNEIITAMRIIKMYTWEKSFAKLISLCRRKEINVIRRSSYFRALNISFFFTSSKFIVFFTFLVFIFTGNHLTAGKVFVTVSLFHNVRQVMTLLFPSAIAAIAETRVSIKRIENFLLLDEIDKKPQITEHSPISECFIELNQLTTKWPAAGEKEEDTLTDISLYVRPGQILAIIGQVGSGKSSLLNVILGELSPIKGTCRESGSIAYASQESWIFSGTVRQNILCGLEYDPQNYTKVIEACALDKDFKHFPNGDLSLVGERGVSLSGGQKARVNLARALYVDADIYLMDDPLSAVDTHVGRHLFDKAINGYLRDKIRVLVTHQLQYLKYVDQILVLKAGHLEAIGSYNEISSSGLHFAKTVENQEFDNEKENISDDDSSFLKRGSANSTATRQRLGSSVSKSSVKENKEEKAKFAEEIRSSGKISSKIYWNYFLSYGSYWWFLLFILSALITQVLYSGSDYWLSLWTNSEEQRARHTNFTENAFLLTNFSSKVIELNATEVAESFENLVPFTGNWWKNPDTYTGVYVFSILIIGVFIFSIMFTIFYFLMCMISSINLHNRMFQSVICAPLLFFDQNPVGRVLNRFTKDIGTVDEILPLAFLDVIRISMNGAGILILVGSVNPWLLVPICFLSIIFVKLRQFYLKTARNVKRLESTTRSPVFTHLSSSLTGLTTLRAHQSEILFQKLFDELQDYHTSAWYMFLSTTRWFGLWLDWVCVIYIGCVVYTCIALRDSLTGSEAGLAITSVTALTGMFQWGVRQSAEVENRMTSVERVMEYSKLSSEASFESDTDKKPPQTWPSNLAYRGKLRNNPFQHKSFRSCFQNPFLFSSLCLLFD